MMFKSKKIFLLLLLPLVFSMQEFPHQASSPEPTPVATSDTNHELRQLHQKLQDLTGLTQQQALDFKSEIQEIKSEIEDIRTRLDKMSTRKKRGDRKHKTQKQKMEDRQKITDALKLERDASNKESRNQQEVTPEATKLEDSYGMNQKLAMELDKVKSQMQNDIMSRLRKEMESLVKVHMDNFHQEQQVLLSRMQQEMGHQVQNAVDDLGQQLEDHRVKTSSRMNSEPQNLRQELEDDTRISQSAPQQTGPSSEQENGLPETLTRETIPAERTPLSYECHKSGRLRFWKIALEGFDATDQPFRDD